MPNWAWCTLEIAGPQKLIGPLYNTGLDFEKIRPTPPVLYEMPSPFDRSEASKKLGVPAEYLDRVADMHGGCRNWYEWRLKHWGVKWSAEVNMMHGPYGGVIEAVISTAWSLPVEMLRYVSAAYRARISASNCGWEDDEFSGSFVVSDGGVSKWSVVDRNGRPAKWPQ